MRIFGDDRDRSCGSSLAVTCLAHMFPVDYGIVFSVRTFQVAGRWPVLLNKLKACSYCLLFALMLLYSDLQEYGMLREPCFCFKMATP